jgi:ubiquinone/menaquinone biosynthesis C-methylase UbiE
MDQRFTLRIGDHLTTADKKRDYNEQVFTEIAPRDDFITRALSFWRDSAWKRELVAQLPPLDAPVPRPCLRHGDIAFMLAKKYPAGRIIGIDITERMLMLARLRNARPNVGFSSGTWVAGRGLYIHRYRDGWLCCATPLIWSGRWMKSTGS